MELKESLLLACLLICSFQRAHTQEPCMLELGDRLKSPIFPPLVYTPEGELLKGHKNKIRLANGKTASLSCHSNSFKKYQNLHTINVTCNDDSLMVGSTQEKFKDLSCDLRILEEVKGSVSGCPSTSQGIFYEYFDSKRSTHIKLAEVCYDYQNDRNVFTRILMTKNAEIDMSFQHDKTLPDNSNIRHTIETMTAYRADNVKKSLQSILSDDSEIAEETLLQVRLLPRVFFNEQLEEVVKFSTNNVGVWKTVAHGNWKKIIESIKSYSENKKESLEVIFGSHGELSLPTSNGKEAKIKLNEKIPIPQYLWTVVHETASGKAVAVVTINNPFLSTNNLKKDVFCKSECEQISWLQRLLKNQNYDRPYYGYTFCCSLKDFGLFSPITTTKLLID